MMEAASRGHLEVIEWLYDNANGGNGVGVAYEALRRFCPLFVEQVPISLTLRRQLDVAASSCSNA